MLIWYIWVVNMSSSQISPLGRPMAPLFKAAMIECFVAAAKHVRESLRHEFIAVCGFALLLHGHNRHTEDIDFVASASALADFLENVQNDAKFEFNGYNRSTYKSSQDILVEFEFLQTEGDGLFFEYSHIQFANPLVQDESCGVVSAQDLLRMKAHAWGDREELKDIEAVRVLAMILKARGDHVGMGGMNDEERRVLNAAVMYTVEKDAAMEEVWEGILTGENCPCPACT
jgi:hypothetical protein